MTAAAADHVEVRRGRYHDSVTLLAVSRAVAAVDGVEAAQVAMATPLNLDVLAAMGFELPPTAADDLVVAIRSRSDAVGPALAALERALAPPAVTIPGAIPAPRTTAAALAAAPSPLVLVSVPGPHAAAEAWDALDAGVSVMLFSDNVAVEDEVALKDAAADRGLLVMGPDCGTAVLGGVALGFANVVRPGQVDLVAASGTGAQQLMSLLDTAGVGVRHCVGLGGRDLGAVVAGRGARQALRVLAASGPSDGTGGPRVVVLVSKPAAAGVAEDVDALARSLGVDLEWAVLGPGRPDLTTVASSVLGRLGLEVPSWPRWRPAEGTRPGTGLVRGLFAGGTLCDEAALLLAERLGPVASNVAVESSWPVLDASGPTALAAALAEAGHAVVDLGDDALTVGRAHPMIDPSLRLEALAAAARDPRVRVVLLDVVLGLGAHVDPAGEHAPAVEAALAAARGDRPFDVVVSLVGTAGDPQGLEPVAVRLADAGAHVLTSNAEAARLAGSLAAGGRS